MQDVIGRQELLDHLLSSRHRFVAVAQRILKCRARAEDVVQEVALKLWQGPATGGLGSPAGYIRRMIRNQAIDGLRQTSVECRLLAPIAAAEKSESACSCPQQRLEACEALRSVMAALDAVPARTRRVMLAHRLDGIQQKSLAAEFGVSPTLVNVIIRDATALCRRAAGDGDVAAIPRALPWTRDEAEAGSSGSAARSRGRRSAPTSGRSASRRPGDGTPRRGSPARTRP